MRTLASPVKWTIASGTVFLIGRTLDPTSGLYTIGKVLCGPTLFTFLYWDSNLVAEQNKTTGFDVLACV